MGHSIPVFFTRIDESVTFTPGSSWTDAQDHITESEEAGSLWQETSRNWWHLYLTVKLAKAFALSPLNYLTHECVTIPREELLSLRSAIQTLIERIAADVPVPELRGDYDYELVSNPSHRAAIDLATPIRDNDDEDQVGLEGARGYFSFLRSLQSACGDALDSRGNLLIVQPQP